ncbi:MAG TPA: chloride channel protein [Clostridiales bacterium]|nr:chloride channel protein [Clostridiales bacterium]
MDSEKNTAAGRKSLLRRHVKLTLRYVRTFVLWAAAGLVIGALGGLIGAAFCYAIREATQLRGAYPWLLYFLPAGGLLIVWLYRLRGMHPTDTNGVLLAIHAPTSIPGSTAPLIFVGTTITHLFGGSAGREGAALQMGGSIGTQIGKWLKFDEKDKKIAVMCGMSGVFAALFGTPMAAAIFSMEVISIGVMYYAALVPCVFSAFTAAALARFWGLMPEQFAIGAVPAWSIETAIVAVGLAAGCALVSELFCIALHTTEHLYKKYLPSPVWRILSGAAIVIVLTLLTGSTRYNGSGVSLIEKCFEGEGLPWDFLIKILFTTVTLEAGFKGGEIVPTLTIGAAFGSFFAFLFGQPVGLMTACGMLGLFVGVTNCPISTLLLGFELFGYEAMPFFVLVIAVSFSFSGYYSLYASQKFIYSKTRTEFINRKTNK